MGPCFRHTQAQPSSTCPSFLSRNSFKKELVLILVLVSAGCVAVRRRRKSKNRCRCLVVLAVSNSLACSVFSTHAQEHARGNSAAPRCRTHHAQAFKHSKGNVEPGFIDTHNTALLSRLRRSHAAFGADSRFQLEMPFQHRCSFAKIEQTNHSDCSQKKLPRPRLTQTQYDVAYAYVCTEVCTWVRV